MIFGKIGVIVIKVKLKKVIKYTMISMKLVAVAGKSKVALWLIALVLPPIISIFNTVINAKMIDGISDLWYGGNIFTPIFWLGILILTAAGYNVFNKFQSRSFWILAQSADEQMMLHMMNRSSELKQISFDSASKFDQVKDSIGSDLSLWNLNSNLLDLLTSIITIVGACIIIVVFHPSLIGVAVLFSIPVFLIDFVLRKYDAKSAVLSRRSGHIMNYYTNILTGVKAAKEMRLFGMKDAMLSDWRLNFQKFKKQSEKIDLCKRSISLITTFIEISYTGLIMFICASSVMDGSISIGDFFLYTSTFNLLFVSLTDISKNVRSALHMSLEYDDFQKFTKETEAGERVGLDFMPTDKISIRFENVSFSYDDTPILQNISFEWQHGETIALIGRNGSGKSTLIKLICGLYECDEGIIYINGVDVKQYSQREIYKLFGIVYQNFCHYQLPLRNILASQSLCDVDNDDALWEAFDRADCSEFKQQLTCGLDTSIGREYNDGIELSGGQWQKLAIARNYFGNRIFMLFDEPAAALDPKAEHKIIQDLLLGIDEVRYKSVLVISHRLSVGKLVDRIIYLEDGRIAEQGKHDELIEHNGNYAKMYATQASLYESNGGDYEEIQIVDS